MTVDCTPQFAPASGAAEPVRFLDDAGQLLAGAEPRLSLDDTAHALRYMMFARAFDDKCLSLQRQGRLGTFAQINGQEAAVMGSAMALDPARDWVVPQYRELPALLRHGHPAERVALYRQGHPEGGYIPDGVKVLQYQVSLAAQLPHAVGLAWGMRLKGESGVAIVYFGDGASSEGDFHESCNLAGVVGAPVIFLLQNNQWAISTPRSIQSSAADLASRAPGYGFPGVSVDGNDLLAVHRVTADAVDRGRRGEGPTLIECHTFRMEAHTTADDPTRYVSPEQRAHWLTRDPIARVQAYLSAQGRWSDDIAKEWSAAIATEVEEVFVRAAEYPPPKPEDIYEHIYAQTNQTLSRQREWHLGEHPTSSSRT